MVWKIKLNGPLEDSQLALVTQHYAGGLYRHTSVEDTESIGLPNIFANQQCMKRMSTCQDTIGMIVVLLLFGFLFFFSRANMCAVLS